MDRLSVSLHKVDTIDPASSTSVIENDRAFAERTHLLAAFSSLMSAPPAEGRSPRPVARARRVFIMTYRLPVFLEREGPGRWTASWVEDEITAKTPNSIAGDVATMWIGVVSRECFAPAALAALIEGGDAGAGDSAAPSTPTGERGTADLNNAGAVLGLTGAVAGGLGALDWPVLFPRLAATYGSADGSTPATPEVLAGLKGSGGVDADGREMRMVPCPTLSAADIKGITAALNAMAILPVFLPPALHEGYATYAQTVLKPAMHNVIETGTQRVQPKAASLDFLARVGEHYSMANEAVVNVLLTQQADEDIVWWHDFWLMRAPLHFLRAKERLGRQRPAQVFFMHAPFPTYEIFRTLPVRDELLIGLLQCDVVGFHSFNYARHFLHACKRLLAVPSRSRPGGELALDVDGRDVIVAISHVGVESSVLDKLMVSPEAAQVSNRLHAAYPGKIIIAGIDALERLSGVALKLLAFETLLEENPVYRNKVVLVQRCESALIALPADVSRTSRELRERVKTINATYGPVIDYEVSHTYSPSYRMGLFHAATVLLQTPICEGLNLRPLEYVYARTRWQLDRACVLEGGDATGTMTPVGDKGYTGAGGTWPGPGLPNGIGNSTPKPESSGASGSSARTVARSPLAPNSGAAQQSDSTMIDTGLKIMSAGMRRSDSGVGSPVTPSEPRTPSVPPLRNNSGTLVPPECGGCVILSEFSTASQALNSNLVVNPWSIRAVAREIDKAIAMPDPERSFRQWRDYQYAIRNPSATWSRAVLRDAMGVRAEQQAEVAASTRSIDAARGGIRSLQRSRAASMSVNPLGGSAVDLDLCASGAGSGSCTPAPGPADNSGSHTPSAAPRGVGGGAVCRLERSCVPQLTNDAVIEAFKEATGARIIILDYGGTLVDRSKMLGMTEGFGNRHDFHTDGYSQTLPTGVHSAVTALASAERTTLFVVSGLRATAVEALGVSTLSAVGLAAENGMFYYEPMAGIADGGSGDYSGVARASATLLSTGARTGGLRGPSSRALQITPMLPSMAPVGAPIRPPKAWVTAPMRAIDGAGGEHLSMDEWSAIKVASLVIMCEYESRVSGSVVREYDGVVLWDFRPADAEWAATQAAFLVADLKEAFAAGGAGFSAANVDRDVSVFLSKSRVEVALRCMNKGRFVNDLLSRVTRSSGSTPGFVLCIGDDTTDEDMFITLNGFKEQLPSADICEVFTATLGKKSATAAEAFCPDVSAVHKLLVRLAEGLKPNAVAE